MNLARILEESIDWRFRSFPDGGGRVRIGDVAAAGWSLFDSGFLFPVMVLHSDALDHNLGAMARLAAARGVRLAPHGKTTMAPQLFARQLAHGAWGMTAATAAHARVYRAFGVERVLIANEVVRPDEARWMAAEMAAQPGVELLCYADSAGAVEILSSAFARSARPLRVLVELGAEGGRAGCRTHAEAIAVAEAIARAPGLALAGVAGFEGSLAGDRTGAALDRVDAFAAGLRELAGALDEGGLFGGEGAGEIVLSAGGSAYPDRIVEGLAGALGGRAAVVLRSGCYVTHDDGFYERISPFAEGFERGRAAAGGAANAAAFPRLRPALELWGAVLSRPEPELAIVGFGKRDAPFDLDLPTPRAVRDRAGGVRAARGMSVARINDQHAYLALPAGDPLSPGDLLSCGVSHPCLAFDRWPLLPVVSDDYRVVDAIRTFF